jgi:mRNA interferase RelE/StbE
LFQSRAAATAGLVDEHRLEIIVAISDTNLMRLLVGPEALMDLRRLDRKLVQAIEARMAVIADDPFGHHPQAKPLKGSPNRYRLRIGDWRVLYVVDRRAGAVEIVRVKSRQEAYRR